MERRSCPWWETAGAGAASRGHRGFGRHSCLSKDGRRQGLKSYPCTDGPRWGHPGPAQPHEQAGDRSKERKREKRYQRRGSSIHVTTVATRRAACPLFFLVKMRVRGKPRVCDPMALWKTRTIQPDPQGSETPRQEVTKGTGQIPLAWVTPFLCLHPNSRAQVKPGCAPKPFLSGPQPSVLMSVPRSFPKVPTENPPGSPLHPLFLSTFCDHHISYFSMMFCLHSTLECNIC